MSRREDTRLSERDRDRDRDRGDRERRDRSPERRRRSSRSPERKSERQKDRSPERRRRSSRSPERKSDRQKDRSPERKKRSRSRSPRKDRDRRDKSPERRNKRSRSPDEKRNDDRYQKRKLENVEEKETPKKEDIKPEMKMEVELKQPANLEELIQQGGEANSKPAFLSKADRKLLALQKRQEEVEKLRLAQEEEKLAREAFFKEAKVNVGRPDSKDNRNDSRNDRNDRDRNDRDRNDRDKDRNNDRNRNDRDRNERDRGDNRDKNGDRDRNNDRDKDRNNDRDRNDRDRNDREKDKKTDNKKEEPEDEKVMNELEREEVKKQYMGIKEKKRRFIKPSEKFKLVFEWDDTEDTSKDLNPLYNEKLESIPQFGRGYLGGIDKREQLSKYKDMIKESKKVLEKNDQKIDASNNSKDQIQNADRQSANYETQLTALDKSESSGRHWTEKKASEMNTRDWRIFKEDFNITTKGGGIPNPIRQWGEANLPSWIMEAVANQNYAKPTAVQMQAIPIGLAGRDILGVAETGSGKTVSFVIPMLVYISKLPKMTKEIEAEGPYALILAPTRELAIQIHEDTEKFASFNGYRCVLVVGGQPILEQAQKLRQGCEILIATPGRLNEILDEHYTVLNQCNYVVLDEADRMVDMGFEPQVVQILEAMPRDKLKSETEEEAERQEREASAAVDHRNAFRTTLMFSATMPPEVERLSRRYLRRPGIIYIGEVGKAVERIKQEVFWMHSDNEKRNKLEYLLKNGPPPPIIIFANQRRTCETLAKFLAKLGYTCTILQGGKSQDQREFALQEFKEGRSDILVATDIAGRGIDVKGITHVINYDLPKTIDQYTHRIGRTARAGTFGAATSFVTNDDVEIMFYLKKMLQASGSAVPHEMAQHEAAMVKPGTVAQKSRRETVIHTNTFS